MTDEKDKGQGEGHEPPLAPFPTHPPLSPFPPLGEELPPGMSMGGPVDPPSDWMETANAHDLPTRDNALVALGRFAFPPAPPLDDEGVAARDRRWTSWTMLTAAVFLTGSFWMNSTPMVAALATIRRLDDIEGVSLLRRAGSRLRKGVVDQAAAEGLTINYSGPDVMPYMTFGGDVGHERMIVFAEAALRAGVYLHPKHNWFMSCAMDDGVIDRALRGTEVAFHEVRKRFGSNSSSPSRPEEQS